MMNDDDYEELDTRIRDLLQKATKSKMYGEVKALINEIDYLHGIIIKQRRWLQEVVKLYAEDMVSMTLRNNKEKRDEDKGY